MGTARMSSSIWLLQIPPTLVQNRDPGLSGPEFRPPPSHGQLAEITFPKLVQEEKEQVHWEESMFTLRASGLDLKLGRIEQGSDTSVTYGSSEADAQTLQTLRDQVASLQGGLELLRRQSQQSSETQPNSLRSEIPLTFEQASSIPSNTRPVTPALCPNPAVTDVGSSTEEASCQPSASYTFNISLARTHLRARGIGTTDADLGGMPASGNPTRPPSPSIQAAFGLDSGSIDPLWLINEEEAVRLFNVYEEEIGIQYPFLDIQRLITQVRNLHCAMNKGSRLGFAFAAIPGPTVIDPQDLSLVKMVLSTALTVEAGGSSQLGKSLFLNVKTSASNELWESASVKTTMLFTLLLTDFKQAIYSFMTGDDLQAWRLVGIVARWCLEMGLHQSAAINKTFKEATERKMVMRLFWCVYTLDRRWGFGAGLPFVIHGFDIDQQLPEPDRDVPYLKAMVEYSRIGDKVWATSYNSARATGPTRDDEVSYLLYRIDQWFEDLPEDLRFCPHQQTTSPAPVSRGLRRLQLLLHLRANQMKILLLQPFLHSTSSLQVNRSKVRLLVNLAKDTIQRLNSLNQSTDIYQNQQMCFNHFLVSALGVIFLVIALAPTEHAALVRDEFHMALDLIRGLSARSYVSSRLWRRISDLRLAWRRLGLNAPHSRGSREASAQFHALATPLTSASNTNISPKNGQTDIDDTFRGSEMVEWPQNQEEPFTEAQMTQELNGFFASMDNEMGYSTSLTGLAFGEEGPDSAQSPRDDDILHNLNTSAIDVSHLFVDML
ncbi:fungal-specific transcription factor domain-containing protein [Colletotrichum navitas]|uniref:Fungal-specific transcription factor domain-containing protein n=1 Tax=Colletotrichum navitas TaxID=681940 RepID=A0AAD8V456_9PEZI|nr:fungal-specific transcription factor domain-containing protein [Colletotrichum navitas]KAK1585384.1 fungal-specific transcription factor domain-containing protein [Colletotrichum navitas]